MNQLRNSPPDPVCTPPDHGGTLHLNGCRNLDQRWIYPLPHAFHLLCAVAVVFLLVCSQKSVSILWSLEIPAIGMCFGVEKGKKGPECNCEARYEVCCWGRCRLQMHAIFVRWIWLEAAIYPQVLFNSKLTTTLLFSLLNITKSSMVTDLTKNDGGPYIKERQKEKCHSVGDTRIDNDRHILATTWESRVCSTDMQLTIWTHTVPMYTWYD